MSFLPAHAIEDQTALQASVTVVAGLSAACISLYVLVFGIADHAYERVHALRCRYERGTTGASGYGLACVAQGGLVTVPLSAIT